MINCEVCNKIFNSYYALSAHLKSHNMHSKQYYDIYINSNNTCKVCSKPTKFISISSGYRDTCSPKCAAIYSQTKREQTNLIKYGTKNPAQNKIIKQKISNTVKSKKCQEKTKQTNLVKYGTEHPMQNKNIVFKAINTSILNNSYSISLTKSHLSRSKESDNFEIKNNCIRIGKLIEQYGQGWLSIKNKLDLIHNKGYTFVRNDQIDLIKNYYVQQSKPEQELYDFVKTLCKDTIHKNRQIIKPYELDIYIPSLKLAIEYNGTYWHSIENGISEDYHLNKSISCRNKNVRLIHIYEFEDLNKQKQLLKDLILGQDNYPKNDFNKNNLINNIPEPELIYTNDRGYHIYGVGKLY